ncbi:MAG: class I SAM-dependent methyltransferase [Candidatus Latescibacterota bacterium]|nr:class I SAM-dependent methyltransferase [Candidatus Latescibacterota bacterium]
MNRRYWNNMADAFSDHVFEVADHDRRGVLRSIARRLAHQHLLAGDFGCGTGSFTRVLARSFEQVIGIDYAARLISEARRRTRRGNVRFEIADLSRAPLCDRVDVAFCINVLIHPNNDIRQAVARSMVQSVRKRGTTVVVVPALESILRTYHTLVECQVEQGASRGRATAATRRLANRELLSLSEGIVNVGGEPTKHYLGDELVDFLGRAGLRVRELLRVEFPWEIELDNVPADLPNLYPWDWLAVGRPA